MKQPSVYLKMRVLGAVDTVEGRTRHERVHRVAGMTFFDEDGHARQFTWRTIQTWFYRYMSPTALWSQFSVNQAELPSEAASGTYTPFRLELAPVVTALPETRPRRFPFGDHLGPRLFSSPAGRDTFQHFRTALVSGQTHFYRSDDEWLAFAERLKLLPCPHCHTTGHLNRHGTLRGFDDACPPRRTIRARRIYCSNRHRRTGCGRTFSVWNAEILPRRSVPAQRLWRFLQKAIVGSLAAAIRAMSTPDDIGSTRSVRTWQRLCTRFDRGQSAIRTALLARGPPPVASASITMAPRPLAAEVLAHLQTAFPHDDSPLAAYQHAMRAFVL